MSIAEKLCCEHVLGLEPYQSARRIGGSGEIWLNANESAIPFDGYQIDSSDYHRYPDLNCPQLIKLYADYASVNKEQLLCVRGADEGIELMIRAFCKPGQDKILITPPTYSMYQVSADIHGVEIVKVSRTADFELDSEAMKSVGEVKLVFICSPNNPTGNPTAREQLVDILTYYKDTALVVVDEAYIEFFPEGTHIGLLEQHANLVIVRTMSKAFGLAAVRCGFVIANPDVIGILQKIIAPYPVPAPVEQIAMQALSEEGIKRMQENVVQINENKRLLTKNLKSITGVEEVYASCGNFVLIRFENEERALELLAKEKIVARTPSPSEFTLQCQRISIGSEQEMRRVVAALSGLTNN